MFELFEVSEACLVDITAQLSKIVFEALRDENIASFGERNDDSDQPHHFYSLWRSYAF